MPSGSARNGVARAIRTRRAVTSPASGDGVGPLSRQMVGVSIVDLRRHGNVRERPQVSLYRRGVNHKAER